VLRGSSVDFSRLDAEFTAHLDERKEVKIAFSGHCKVERFFAKKEKTHLRALSSQWQNGFEGMAREKAIPLKI
jgi:hypothetical protein